MAVIFSAQAGRTVAVPGNSLPMRLTLTDWNGYLAFKSILTNVGVSGMGGYQFMHSLQDMIYVYVFNERIGQMRIGGLAFAGICEKPDDKTGFEFVQDWYEEHRITTRFPPITVTIGATFSVNAFLTGVEHGITDPSTKVDQFTLQMHWVPRKKQSIDNAAPPPEGGRSQTTSPGDNAGTPASDGSAPNQPTNPDQSPSSFPQTEGGT